MKTPPFATRVMALVPAFAGCSSQPACATGQGGQKQECHKTPDREQRTRREQSAATSRECDQAEAAAAKKPSR